MPIEIMRIDDYEDVYDLWINTPGMGLNTVDDSKSGIEKYLRRNPNTCFIAKENAKVIGAILCGHDGRRGYIHHTAVNLENRNRGIGKALVEHALEALRNENINKAAFVVFSRNEAGNKFWEELGFKKREDLVYRDKVISIEELKRIDT